jgi:hypothetical protein
VTFSPAIRLTLGRVAYLHGDTGWTSRNTSFAYGMHNPDTSASGRAERQAYQDRHPWVASTYSMGDGFSQEVQVSLALLEPDTPRVALGYLPTQSGDSAEVLAWPEALKSARDGCVDQRLARGFVPRRLSFDPHRRIKLVLER